MARSNRKNNRFNSDENYRDRGLREQQIKSNRNREKQLFREFSGKDYIELQDEWEELEDYEEMES